MNITSLLTTIQMIRFPLIFRPFRIFLPKIVHEGEVVPRFYGVAFVGRDDYLDENEKFVPVSYRACYPIPFNWIVALWMRASIFLKWGASYEWYFHQWNNAYETGRASVKNEGLK